MSHKCLRSNLICMKKNVFYAFFFSLPLNGGCRVHGHSHEFLPGISGNDNTHRYSGKSNRDNNGQEFNFLSPPRCHKATHHNQLCPEVSKALAGVMLIAEQKKRMEESIKVINQLLFINNGRKKGLSLLTIVEYVLHFLLSP